MVLLCQRKENKTKTERKHQIKSCKGTDAKIGTEERKTNTERENKTEQIQKEKK